MSILPRVRSATLIGGMVLACLTACSEDRADPATESTQKQFTFTTVEDLGEACEDIEGGYPDAPAYIGDGPHPMALLVKDFETETEARDPDLREWRVANSTFPGEPLSVPGSPATVQLLACGTTRPGADQINVCQYKSAFSLTASIEYPLLNQLYTVTVYELHSGREVTRVELDARFRQPLSSCPSSVGDSGGKIYAKAQPFELYELVEDLVTEPAK
nr:hypothetical protein [Micromonospora sp. DSM 115978]